MGAMSMQSFSLKSINTYIALGSNINPFENIAKAINKLASQFKVIAQSSCYETSPYGFKSQNNFLNLVIALETKMDPQNLLDHLQSIELELGRERLQKNGPRTIDLDILLYGESLIQEPHLIIPHQELLERDFMLVPLQEIAPHLTHPKTTILLSDYKASPPQHIIKKVDVMF